MLIWQALIHLSELSWDFLVKPEQRVRVGDKLRCVVISVDHKKGRISLSLKRMQVGSSSTLFPPPPVALPDSAAEAVSMC